MSSSNSGGELVIRVATPADRAVVEAARKSAPPAGPVFTAISMAYQRGHMIAPIPPTVSLTSRAEIVACLALTTYPHGLAWRRWLCDRGRLVTVTPTGKAIEDLGDQLLYWQVEAPLRQGRLIGGDA